MFDFIQYNSEVINISKMIIPKSYTCRCLPTVSSLGAVLSSEFFFLSTATSWIQKIGAYDMVQNNVKI